MSHQTIEVEDFCCVDELVSWHLYGTTRIHQYTETSYAIALVLPLFDSWSIEKHLGENMHTVDLVIESEEGGGLEHYSSSDSDLGLAICLAALGSKGIAVIFKDTPEVPKA